ncbi:MAG: VOC family protein, partial [Jatrophihabitans sp.]
SHAGSLPDTGAVGLDHVTLTAGDLPASLAFYDAALGALGLVRVVELADEEDDAAPVEAVGYGTAEQPLLWVVAGAVPTRGAHMALRAATPAQVDDFHAAALAGGGRSHDAPRRWALFRRGTYHAIVTDPAGNLLEAVAQE